MMAEPVVDVITLDLTEGQDGGGTADKMHDETVDMAEDKREHKTA